MTNCGFLTITRKATRTFIKMPSKVFFNMLFRATRKTKNRDGFTLVEVMITMLITLIIMGGVYNTFTKETINTEKEHMLTDMQTGARVILDIIAKDIRSAGFQGCEGTLQNNTLFNSGTKDMLQAYTSRGTTNRSSPDCSLPILTVMKKSTGGSFEYLGTPFAYENDVAAEGSLPDRVYKIGSDVLTVRYLSGETSVTSAMPSSSKKISAGDNTFNTGDILKISDCEHYSIFQKTNSRGTASISHEVKSGFLNNTPDLGHAYGVNSKVYKLTINTYFVDNETLDLSRNSKSIDIAENVEDLQFQYKIDANNNENLTDDAWSDKIPAGSDTSDAAAIRIFVLVRSDFETSGHKDIETYDYPNSPYYSPANPFSSKNKSRNAGGGAPGDGYYRLLMSTTVYLRNYKL